MIGKWLALATLAISILGVGCADAPSPGDIGAYCVLLQSGGGLSDEATALDYDQLERVAPPEIRDTIATLRTAAGDFDELLTEEPPDLEAMFRARFDPAAERYRAELDRHAEQTCGIEVDRPPSTRWNNYVRENHAGARWRDVVAMSFDVESDRVVAATAVFADRPEPTSLVEEVCSAGADFLVGEGSGEAIVRVLIGSVVWIENPAADADCHLP